MKQNLFAVILKKVKEKYLDLKISTKILLIYLLFLVFSVAISSWIYQRIYSDITTKKVSEMSLQTLYSIKSNITTMVENISYNSRLILSNRNIQSMLQDPGSGYNVVVQYSIDNYLTSIIDSMSNISSIYLFDEYGNRYSVDRLSAKKFSFSRIEDAAWYDEVVRRNGYYILRLNAGESANWNSKGNYVSFIRAVNDIELQKRIGILMINISEDYFVKCYKDIVREYGTNILLLDENNRSIVSKPGDTVLDPKDILSVHPGKSEYISITKKVKGQDYILSCLKIEQLNWKIVSIVPFRELVKESSIFSLVALCVVLANGVMLFIGAVFVSRLITNPIKKLLKSMKGIENGEFKKVKIAAGNDEIGKLRDGYNIMVSEIENLIRRVIDDQKTKRIAELNILQAQIKPHFLYNTLDAMSYLALSGKNEQLYQALEALGSYYRTSLSKGSEVITIREEVNIVKNYLLLQKLRYGDIFEDVYEIDDSIYEHKILKLVLQPLVENALYHGIKPKGEKGTIAISARRLDESKSILISVEDDGIGMTEEELETVLNGRIEKNSSSFGLRGTIERLRIFYSTSELYSIESRKRYGTRVTLTIPM